jgi:nicotinamidase-related amidase
MELDKLNDVLLVVDPQNDFITGTLPVPGAEKVMPAMRQYADMFETVLVSKDMHPANHSSFVEQGGPWPPHCIAGNFGSNIHTVFDGMVFEVFEKGTKVEVDAYSAFDGTGLTSWLQGYKAKRLFICGLATDYCVKATVMDALKRFDGEVYVLMDAIAAVNVQFGDGATALVEMVGAGAKLITMKDLS